MAGVFLQHDDFPLLCAVKYAPLGYRFSGSEMQQESHSESLQNTEAKNWSPIDTSEITLKIFKCHTFLQQEPQVSWHVMERGFPGHSDSNVGTVLVSVNMMPWT